MAAEDRARRGTGQACSLVQVTRKLPSESLGNTLSGGPVVALWLRVKGAHTMAACKILFLAAHPAQMGRLELETEVIYFDRALRAGHRVELFRLQAWRAATAADVAKVLEQEHPDVVHFLGHRGAASRAINVRAKGGDDHSLAGAVARTHDRATIVILDDCFDYHQAQAIGKIIDCVVGLEPGQGRAAARAFAVAFYRTFGDTGDLQLAIKQGISAQRNLDTAQTFRARLVLNGDAKRRLASLERELVVRSLRSRNDAFDRFDLDVTEPIERVEPPLETLSPGETFTYHNVASNELLFDSQTLGPPGGLPGPPAAAPPNLDPPGGLPGPPAAAPPKSLPLPRHLDENVQFTVYRPKAIQPSTWYTLLAFAHLSDRRPDAPVGEPHPLEEVERQAQQSLGPMLASYAPSTQDSATAVPREGELTMLPEVDGLEFNPPRASFRWLESVHREEFRLRTSRDVADGVTLRGRLSVLLGCVLLAEVNLAVRVARGAAAEPWAHDSANAYRKIFASYSHKDTGIVEQFERFGRALGDSYLRDVIDLRSGEDWNPRLLDFIKEADVFQLFWSSNSMTSKFVRQEWEHALSLERSNFIRPIYWEKPLPSAPGLPPESLARLHFHRLGPAASKEDLGVLPLAQLNGGLPPDNDDSGPHTGTYIVPASVVTHKGTSPSGALLATRGRGGTLLTAALSLVVLLVFRRLLGAPGAEIVALALALALTALAALRLRK